MHTSLNLFVGMDVWSEAWNAKEAKFGMHIFISGLGASVTRDDGLNSAKSAGT